MAIVQNTLTRSNTPFYNSFVPYRTPDQTRATGIISEMVSVNYIVPEESTIINHGYGIDNVYIFELVIKNITQNTRLNIEIVRNNLFQISETNFTLSGQEVKTVLLTTNNNYINSLVHLPQVYTTVDIIVRNIPGEIATISTNVVLLEQELLPREITLI